MKLSLLIKTLLHQYLHLSMRAALEFLLVVVALSLAEPNSASLWVGGLAAVSGFLLRLWSAGYQHFDPRSPRGPYRYLRHPYLLGSALVFLGLGLASAHTLVMAVIMTLIPLIYLPSYRRAEAAITAELGPAAAPLRASVPALLPRPLPLKVQAEKRSDLASPYSLGLAFRRGRHRELNAVVIFCPVAAFLYLLAHASNNQKMHAWFFMAMIGLMTARVVYYALRRLQFFS